MGKKEISKYQGVSQTMSWKQAASVELGQKILGCEGMSQITQWEQASCVELGISMVFISENQILLRVWRCSGVKVECCSADAGYWLSGGKEAYPRLSNEATSRGGVETQDENLDLSRGSTFNTSSGLLWREQKSGGLSPHTFHTRAEAELYRISGGENGYLKRLAILLTGKRR